jgi:hypothetical protein
MDLNPRAGFGWATARVSFQTAHRQGVPMVTYAYRKAIDALQPFQSTPRSS